MEDGPHLHTWSVSGFFLLWNFKGHNSAYIKIEKENSGSDSKYFLVKLFMKIKSVIGWLIPHFMDDDLIYL